MSIIHTLKIWGSVLNEHLKPTRVFMRNTVVCSCCFLLFVVVFLCLFFLFSLVSIIFQYHLTLKAEEKTEIKNAIVMLYSM